MSLVNVAAANRVHIAFFGCINAGKSSIVNAICNQDVSLVSQVKGTTTDPVKKTMEILPLGPVVIIDTAGLDDESILGELRIEKTKKILNKTDIAILIIDSSLGIKEKDEELIDLFKEKKLPYLIVYNKSDLLKEKITLKENEILTSAIKKENIEELKEKIAKLIKEEEKEKYIIKDIVEEKDTIILVIPIDESAPKGRLILPQHLTIRELLDCHCKAICCQDSELEETLKELNKKPKAVVVDSQIFEKIKDIVPKDICLTSFSILFARYKGNLEELIKGANKIKHLKDNDYILISEGCTHHRQCNDIGSVKFPKWLKNFNNKNLNFEFSSGEGFPNDLSKYALIIHCGGCMLNEKEMQNRINQAKEANIPIVNYGIAIAYMNGILKRSLEIFPNIYKTLE